uniref:DNA polymerase I n=1 Tax=uncultured Planctomycetales bacterium HF0500_02G17 TaxID=723608 RepID=E7C4L4_9BACT|nr:DNA polymerase I - 3'-5' exonuclease and polymerase domains [uncultured Planctomycetales bacterium HF0500_02G17]
MKTLYLIDGFAQFFRAYHAIRTPMTSPVTKEPTNMTFGFVGMMLKLLRGEGQMGGPPDYVAVVIDVSGDRGTFRSQLYPEYKATRDAPPEDLMPQVERALAMLRAAGVPVLGAEGFEADDVIATIASTFSERHPDVRVRIVSKDKDLKQLLGEGVPPTEMYDVHTDEVITAETLRAEFGITPAQVIDMLALMGDTVDNVPGVPGVGPKTAAQLVAEFGSVEAVVAEVREEKAKKDWKIKGKRRENILAAAEAGVLELSRELVALRHDVPVEMDLEASATPAFRLGEWQPLLEELGFNRYQHELKLLMGGAAEDGGGAAPAGAPARRARKVQEEPGGLFAGLDDDDSGATVSEAEGDYRCVRTAAELAELVKALEAAQAIAVDTETTAIRPMRADLVGLSFAVEPGSGWYVPVRSPEPETHLDEATVLGALRPVLEDATKPKLGHNLKYDILVLRRAGVELRGHVSTVGAGDWPGGDSMIASYLVDASRSSHSMDALAMALLERRNIPISELIGTGKKQKTFDTVPLDRATPYAAEDADVTLQLCQRLLPELQEMELGALFGGLEMPLVDVLAELEWNGIRVDPDELDRQRGRIEGRVKDLRNQIADEAMGAVGREFDADSPKQLAGVLFNKPDAADPGLGLRVIKRGKTGPSTDAEVLEKLSQDASVKTPIPDLILEYRQLTKLVNTYLVNLVEEIDPRTKRIHASFNQTVAATGRLSSSDPNLQNIPIRTELGREIRKAFVAEPGHLLVAADYSQIELRLLAHLSRDPALIEAFREGQDIHAAVAAQIHDVPLAEVSREQRNGAKMVNFGIVYGVTAFGLARRLGVSNSEAGEIIDGYKRRFAGITTFLEECIAQAHAQGYVETMMKRRRPIPDIDSRDQNRRALAERMAINSVVQGSAADLIKIAMVDLHRRLSPRAAAWREGAGPEIEGVRMLLQIHDELVFEAPKDRAEAVRDLIVARMEAAMALDVPLVADASVSGDWFGAK